MTALRLRAGTTLYLGLIHLDDGSGDQARIAAASAFGVATGSGHTAAHRHIMAH
jgi:hypothetical protein